VGPCGTEGGASSFSTPTGFIYGGTPTGPPGALTGCVVLVPRGYVATGGAGLARLRDDRGVHHLRLRRYSERNGNRLSVTLPVTDWGLCYGLRNRCGP
jgi:hypothetical protein